MPMPNPAIHAPGFAVDARDTTAAGDTFNAALAVALTEELPLVGSLRFANAAAALSVTRVWRTSIHSLAGGSRRLSQVVNHPLGILKHRRATGLPVCRPEHNIIDSQLRVDLKWLRLAHDLPTLAPGLREGFQEIDLAAALPISVKRAFGASAEYAGLKPPPCVSELKDSIFGTCSLEPTLQDRPILRRCIAG